MKSNVYTILSFVSILLISCIVNNTLKSDNINYKNNLLLLQQKHTNLLNKQRTKKKLSSSTKQKILKLRPNLKLVDDYSYLIDKYCDKKIIDEMIAIFEQESGFDSSANNNDDWGIGQINAKTWKVFFEVKDKKELLNPILNIKYSCKILEMAHNSHSDKVDWAGFYHSWNTQPRKKYMEKININLKKLRKNNDIR